jgi:hypothetical protein
MMAMNSWIGAAAKGLGVVSAVWLLAGPAAAQENLDAGKSGAQLFKSNCAICHKSAQALNKSGGGLFGLDSFLREHYTSSRETAAAIAAYLNSVGGPAEAQPPKKRVRTEKKKEAKPDAKPSDAKPSDAKPPEAKPSDTKPEQKKPEEKSGEKPADKKPEKKEGGKAALVTGAPQRG